MSEQAVAQHQKIGNGIGDSNGLSWSISYLDLVAKQSFVIFEKEKVILRELAKKIAELASLPLQQEKKKLWKKHHSLEQTHPLIFCDPEVAWYEIIKPEHIDCQNALARIWEYKLKKELFWAENIKDDRSVEASFSVHYIGKKTSRAFETNIIGGLDGGAYCWESPLSGGYEILDKLRPSCIQVDMQRTRELESLAHDVFDGILDVKLEGVWWWSLGMTMDLIFLRGFENVLYDFYDHPDELRRLMSFLCDENLSMLDYLEENDLLTLNNGGDFHGTGGYAWTDELPTDGYDGAHVRTLDMWGFCESQETINVSPELFGEFVFPYQKKILDRFGLNIYGCCEPLDTRWHIIKKIPRLRKVTVSPWSKDEVMAENLGDRYVYCKKVNPSLLATPTIDENAIRKELRTTFDNTKRHNCRVEVLMRDVLTLAGNAGHAARWVEIAREEAERT